MPGSFSSPHRAGPARVVAIDSYREQPGEWALLSVRVPGASAGEPAGVLLLDVDRDELHIRLRRDWAEFAAEEDAEVLAVLEHDFHRKSREMGGRGLIDWLEVHASFGVELGERTSINVRNFPSALSRLYREHVPSRIRQFETHLPLYSLEVAAGPFLTNPDDVEAEEWIEAPDDLRLDPNMFVAIIRGRSMEPRIPDGSLCVFRRGVVGSRNGRLVLVRNSELADENRYTVKRYRSEKSYSEDEFQHTRIRLESLNPDYPSWDLDPDEAKYQIVAEFVRVLGEN